MASTVQLGTATNAASDLSAAFSTTAVTPSASAACLAVPDLRISALNGAAATFTILLRHTDSANTKIRDVKYTVAKPTNADTVFGVTLDPILVQSTEKLLMVITSSNGSDTAATVVTRYVDANQVALTPTGLDGVDIDGVTCTDALKLVAAMAAGKVTGAGTGTEVFKGLDQATTRFTSTVDAAGNRTVVIA